MAGDGYQNGGALVVGVNGETLFHYVQEGAPDHASNLDLLKVYQFYFLTASLWKAVPISYFVVLKIDLKKF